jgi:hypothetical protein
MASWRSCLLTGESRPGSSANTYSRLSPRFLRRKSLMAGRIAVHRWSTVYKTNVVLTSANSLVFFHVSWILGMVWHLKALVWLALWSAGRVAGPIRRGWPRPGGSGRAGQAPGGGVLGAPGRVIHGSSSTLRDIRATLYWSAYWLCLNRLWLRCLVATLVAALAGLCSLTSCYAASRLLARHRWTGPSVGSP